MADNGDEKVMFQIGLTSDPKNIQALEAIAQKVLETQSRMLDSVNAVQGAAKATENAVGGATDALNRFHDAANDAARLPAAGGTGGGGGASGPAVPPTPKPQGPKASDFDAAVKEREKYLKALDEQRAAMNKYIGELDEAANAQDEASERMSQSALKSARGLIDAVKGFAMLGIASEENTQKLLEGLVVIEGYFMAAKGGLEALEGLRAGWKAVRASTEAATAVQKAKMALAGPELAQLRAYNLALAQEAAAANAAAAANSRLAGARTGAGAAATGAAGATAAGAGVTAGAGAATAVGGGFLATTVAGVGVGVAGTIAAAAAALASVSLVAVELTEVFSGTANEVGSVTDSIASWEVSMVSWLGELTGWFDLVGNAALQEARSKADLFKIQTELNDALRAVETGAALRIERGLYESDLKSRQFRSDTLGTSSSKATDDMDILTDAVSRYQEALSEVNQMRAEGLEDTQEYARILEQAQYYQQKIEESAKSAATTNSASAKEQIEAAKKIAEKAKTELDTRKQALKALQESQMTAAERFAALDDLEKQKAIDALKQARTKGGESLSEEQRALLRGVGGNESTRFARQADLAEAKRFGFDETFGVGFKKEQQALQARATALEVKIKQQANIVVNIEDRNKQLVEQVVSEYDKVIRGADRWVIEETQRRAMQEKAKLNQEAMIAARNSKNSRQ